MNKAAPSPLRVLTMVVFALSCFGLLLFLWLSFGGPIRHGIIVYTCDTARLLTAVAEANPALGTLVGLLNGPTPEEICPQPGAPTP